MTIYFINITNILSLQILCSAWFSFHTSLHFDSLLECKILSAKEDNILKWNCLICKKLNFKTSTILSLYDWILPILEGVTVHWLDCIKKIYMKHCLFIAASIYKLNSRLYIKVQMARTLNYQTFRANSE